MTIRMVLPVVTIGAPPSNHYFLLSFPSISRAPHSLVLPSSLSFSLSYPRVTNSVAICYNNQLIMVQFHVTPNESTDGYTELAINVR